MLPQRSITCITLPIFFLLPCSTRPKRHVSRTKRQVARPKGHLGRTLRHTGRIGREGPPEGRRWRTRVVIRMVAVVEMTAGKAVDKRHIPIVWFGLRLKDLRGRLFNDDGWRLLDVRRTVLAFCPRCSRVWCRWQEEGFPSLTNHRLRTIGRKGETFGLCRPAGRRQHVVHHLRRERIIRFPATGRLHASAA